MNREMIYAALFAKISALNGIVTASRRLQHWSDVPAAQQPALFQTQVSETAQMVRGIPIKWTFDINLYLYVNTGNDSNVVPSTTLNGLIDQIEAALAPDVTGQQTLGSLVSHCSINGRIETDEGVLGSQAVAIIPIQIVTT